MSIKISDLVTRSYGTGNIRKVSLPVQEEGLAGYNMKENARPIVYKYL